jgi:hypothetical protein
MAADATAAPDAPDAAAEADQITDAAPDTAHRLGTGWLDASVEPTSVRVRCMRPHGLRTVRFVITPWKRGGGDLRASLLSGDGSRPT